MSVKRSFNSVRLGSYVDKPSLGGETYLTRSVKMGDYQAAKDFLEIGADADAKNAKGELPLHIALQKRDIQAMRLLLGYGANVYCKQNGLTLREHAQKLGMKDIAAEVWNIEKRLEARARAMGRGIGWY